MNKDEFPNYKYLKNLFTSFHEKEYGQINWVFDWNNLY